MVASTAPQLSWPSTRINGTPSTATAYSMLAMVSVVGEIAGDPAHKEIAPAAVEGVFGRDAQIGAAQDGGERDSDLRPTLPAHA